MPDELQKTQWSLIVLSEIEEWIDKFLKDRMRKNVFWRRLNKWLNWISWKKELETLKAGTASKETQSPLIKKPGSCHYCGIIGHWQDECRKKKKKNQRKRTGCTDSWNMRHSTHILISSKERSPMFGIQESKTEDCRDRELT